MRPNRTRGEKGRPDVRKRECKGGGEIKLTVRTPKWETIQDQVWQDIEQNIAEGRTSLRDICRKRDQNKERQGGRSR